MSFYFDVFLGINSSFFYFMIIDDFNFLTFYQKKREKKREMRFYAFLLKERVIFFLNKMVWLVKRKVKSRWRWWDRLGICLSNLKFVRNFNWHKPHYHSLDHIQYPIYQIQIIKINSLKKPEKQKLKRQSKERW